MFPVVSCTPRRHLRPALAVRAALALLLAGSSWAVAADAPQNSAFTSAGQDSSIPGRELVGASVQSSDGQMVGAVDDVVVGSDGAPLVVIGLAGALGLGEKDVAVPISQVTGSRPYPEGAIPGTSGTGFYGGNRGVIVSIGKDLAALRSAPPFTAGGGNAKAGQPSSQSGVPEGVTKEPKSSTESGGPG